MNYRVDVYTQGETFSHILDDETDSFTKARFHVTHQLERDRGIWAHDKEKSKMVFIPQIRIHKLEITCLP